MKLYAALPNKFCPNLAAHVSHCWSAAQFKCHFYLFRSFHLFQSETMNSNLFKYPGAVPDTLSRHISFAFSGDERAILTDTVSAQHLQEFALCNGLV